MRISDWSSDVCSSDLPVLRRPQPGRLVGGGDQPFAVRRDIAAVRLHAGFARLVRVLFAVPDLDGPHIDLAPSGLVRSPGCDRPFRPAFPPVPPPFPAPLAPPPTSGAFGGPTRKP